MSAPKKIIAKKNNSESKLKLPIYVAIANDAQKDNKVHAKQPRTGEKKPAKEDDSEPNGEALDNKQKFTDADHFHDFLAQVVEAKSPRSQAWLSKANIAHVVFKARPLESDSEKKEGDSSETSDGSGHKADDESSNSDTKDGKSKKSKRKGAASSSKDDNKQTNKKRKHDRIYDDADIERMKGCAARGDKK